MLVREAHRIRNATQNGSGLSGVLYVLDEPSIGLHQSDNDKLLDTLKMLRDKDNTVIVVEHDEDAMRAADYLVDIGRGAGINGGNVIAAGTPEQVIKNKDSITGQYLSGKRKIDVPKTRRAGNGKSIVVEGARENNLKNVNAEFPLGKFVALTGVSGSGKSTLLLNTLYPALMRALYNSKLETGKHDIIRGMENIDKVVDIDVPDENIVNRMSGRRVCKACGSSYHIENKKPKVDGVCDACGGELQIRKDDAPETVLDRLNVYHEQTEPLKDYYAKCGKLRSVEGTAPIKEITAAILKVLED